MNVSELPFPWNRSIMAIIPGLLAILGLIRSDFSTQMLVGLIGLALYLGFAYWWNDRQLPGWSLMAIGMLASMVLVVASGTIGGLVAIIAGTYANLFMLLIFLILSIVLLAHFRKEQDIFPIIWGLFALVIMCQLAVRVKYFVFLGVSWSIAGQWLNISLYAAIVGLLFPVVLGTFLSRKYGLQTMLFVIGMIYVSLQILMDVNSKVSDQIGYTERYFVYQALVPFLITVLAPLWYLRTRASHYRVVGMLFIIGMAVLINLLVVGASYEGQLPTIIWISFIPYTLSILLTLILAYQLYQSPRKTPI